MKQRSTTPVSKLLRVSSYFATVVFFVALLTGLYTQTSSAQTNTERQARIDELTKQIDQQVASSRELNTQSSEITSQIDAMKREREHLQADLEKNQVRQDQLVGEMAAVEIKIQLQQELLGRAMADAYVEERISPIEMLASSSSIGDFLDQQTMNTIVREKLSDSIKAVNKLRRSLLAKQTEMRQIIGDQQNEALALKNKLADQEKMLVASNDASGKLEQITKQMASERQTLQQQQQASMAAALSSAVHVTPGTVSQPVVPKPETPAPLPSESTTPTPTPAPVPTPTPAAEPVVLPNGGYPSYLQDCFVDQYALSYGIDPWGYGCRQCVSYTAWKVLQKTGRAAKYWGNAKDWPASAARVGYATGTVPRAGSVGVMTSGPYGHVVWVESVNANGTINISQYNYWLPGKSNGGWGWYSEFQNVSPWAYQVYIYT